jgi:hypothetical protein
VIVDCAHYREGRRQHEGPMELGAAAEICLQEDGFVWLGLFEPDQAELGEVQARFGLHDLAVEDAQSWPPGSNRAGTYAKPLGRSRVAAERGSGRNGVGVCRGRQPSLWR